MSLSITDYLNSSTYQNTRLSSAEKLSHKDDAAETGKTKQSAVSSSFDQVNLGEDGVAVTQASRVQEIGQSVSQQKSVSPCMDTVEISQEGRKAASAMLQTGTDTGEVEAYQPETDDLSEYTDTELKQMYYRGEITRQEYENQTGETIAQ